MSANTWETFIGTRECLRTLWKYPQISEKCPRTSSLTKPPFFNQPIDAEYLVLFFSFSQCLSLIFGCVGNALFFLAFFGEEMLIVVHFGILMHSE